MHPSPRLLIRSVLRLTFVLAAASMAPASAAAAAPGTAETRILEVRKIWDAGHHNAFTDLVHWRGRWWCTFRESTAHVGGDGGIRVIESADGGTWTSAAYLTEKDIDLRDPKFSVTPDGRLMLVCGGSVYLGTKQLKGRQPRVLFSTDGRTWTPPAQVLREGDWLWRVTWHDGVAYGVSYGNGVKKPGDADATEWTLALYSSRDGLKWDLVAPLEVTGRPNETTVRFTPTGEMIAMVRREAGNTMGVIGRAAPPYRNWTWRQSNHRLGGPNFILQPGAGWIVTTRDYVTPPAGATKGVTTMVARLGEDGRLSRLVTLPSGGDTSYAGMVWHTDGRLWLSYYSSHEGKSAIYLAKLAVP
ncbi:MAG: exo-alpha-sialidase [Verrucomicrobia bacterium]|nr:exo-alpha-sialidase [Verrucomicrobiota bacterium]